MAVSTTLTKSIIFLSLLLLLLSCHQCSATRGLTVGLLEQSSLDHSKMTKPAATSKRPTKMLEASYGASPVFAMLPKAPVPPSGPIGGINGSNN
ncbi:hypothetical protein BHE74_00040423 [Ensete ventricosum]|uniref:Uncharacterized protein n=1 Tax=Ensete ventricosum TaxID=4639 RepID=A0A444DBW9_ENSVE|nr:hypothetical protein B296_00058657 [Ensete ventricosum]RWV95685.1 hypothetical protein GW17_00041670 [Ensete ventricosum]RWW53114.1 hypothetical protein BHE74_00040423 [Ensete ventricosum]